VRAVEDKLLKVVPNQYKQDAHHWLILHGRYVCLARKPGCPECLIADLCEFKDKTKPEAQASDKRTAGRPRIADRIRTASAGSGRKRRAKRKLRT
jgi:endonuclease III